MILETPLSDAEIGELDAGLSLVALGKDSPERSHQFAEIHEGLFDIGHSARRQKR